MIADAVRTARTKTAGIGLGLYRLLDPAVRTNPYPLYDRMRSEAPVLWDPFLKAWVVTRYADVVTVLHDRRFSAMRTPTPDDVVALGLDNLTPIARLMVQQMLFMDPPAHGRIRNLAQKAFTPRHVEALRSRIQDIVDGLLDAVEPNGSMDIMQDLAGPLPATVTAQMLGVPVSDCDQLTAWSADFAHVLGNFQHDPDHAAQVLRTVEATTAYFRDVVQGLKDQPHDGLVNALLTAELDGDRLTEDEVVANSIITMVGGQETTTSLIGNGWLTLFRHPEQLKQLREDLSLLPSAIEEMLRFESPIQHTGRMAREDVELGGQVIHQRQAVMAVMGAANRDPERFPDPNVFDIRRQDNRHLAFGWATHFCFGAPLARMEASIAFATMLRRFPHIRLRPDPVCWQDNLCYRGPATLRVTF